MPLSVRTVVTWLLVVLVAVYLVHSPAQAFGLVRTGAEAVVDSGEHLLAWVRSLF